MRPSPLSLMMIPLSLSLLAACERAAQPAPPPPPAMAVEAGAQTLGVHAMNPWLRATPPGATVGAGYLILHNPGADSATLVAVESSAAARIEIHEMREVEGMMQMRELEGGITVGPGEQVNLAPGGLHLMLMDLAAPLVEGEQVPLTLRFASGETVELQAPVRREAPDGGGHDAHHGHH